MKKILLLGDSIRLGYDKYVKMAFEDVAEVYYPVENCRFAAYLCRRLFEWKRDLSWSDEVDVVHWNAGLWDVLILPDGKHLTPIEIYKEYVDRTCCMIKLLFPKAKMIFATSTPVQEELFTGECKRLNKDTEEYNKAAPVEYHSDLTHYYTKEGTRLLTNQVVACFEETLGMKGKALDYDTLFAETEDILGI